MSESQPTDPVDQAPRPEPLDEATPTEAPDEATPTETPGEEVRPPVVYLHIGTMKSGTSYIQGMLWRNRVALRDHGVLYPGESWQDQVAAVRDIIEAHGGGRETVAGSWATMRDALVTWPGGTAIISMELLSVAAPDRLRAMVESLAPAEVHVIITARDLARVIPSAWQESTQNRQTWTWPAYLASVTGESDEEPAAYNRFWRQHDVAGIAARWAEAVEENHIHVVVVPAAGGPRDELWRRFCSVIGLDAAAYSGANKVRGNPAVGAASAEFLRRLNVMVGKQLDVAAYEQVVKRFLAKRTLAHRTSEFRLVLPERSLPWAVERATQMITELRDSGVQVAGDLDELIPQPTPPSGVDQPDEIPESEVADAGIHAVEALILQLAAPDARPDRGNREQRRRRRAAGESS